MAMKNYTVLAVQIAFYVLHSRASSVAVLDNVTDIISGCCEAGSYSQLFETQRHVIVARSWTLSTSAPQLKVISHMIRLFQNYSTATLKVIIYSDCLTAEQEASLYKELDDHSPILRHVRWIILSHSELASYPLWSSRYQSLSCDAVFVTWPFLDVFDVSEPSYAAVCPRRRKLATTSYLSMQAPLPLWNATIRIGCRVQGSTRYCYMPLYYAIVDALRLYSVRLDSTQNEKGVELGVANDMGFFSGTLGELQNRTFDLYLVDLVQEWDRFRMLEYMKHVEIQSLTFAFALPSAAPASADPSYLSVGSFTMTAVAAFAVAATLIVLKIEEYETCSLIGNAIYLTILLMFLLFSQPLSSRLTNIPTKGPVLKTGKRRTKEVPERRLITIRAVLAIWLFSSVILVTGLKSSLISQLKYPLVTEQIDSVAKLEKALRTNAISPCLLHGTGAAEYILSSDQVGQSVYKLIGRYIHQNATVTMANAPSDCSARMNRRTHVYINFYTALKQLAWNGNKGVIISRDSLVTFFGSTVAPRGWPYTQSMRSLTSKIMESGLILKHAKDADFQNSSMMTAEYAEYKRDLVEAAGSSEKPLGMLHFKTAFCTFGLGNVLACLVALLEIIFLKRRQCRTIDLDRGFRRARVKQNNTYSRPDVHSSHPSIMEIPTPAVISVPGNACPNWRMRSTNNGLRRNTTNREMPLEALTS